MITMVKLGIISVLLYIGLLVFFVAAPAFGQQPDKRLLARIPQVPQGVTIDGKRVIYYELQLKNTSSDTFRLRRVEISGAGPLLSIEGSALDGSLSDAVLVPQNTSTLYIELENLHADDSVLNHQLEYALSSKDKESGLFGLSVVARIAKAPAPILGAPLREGNWAAIYSPVWQRGHRRVFFSFDDTDYLPGRFAIDFVRLDSIGRYASEMRTVWPTGMDMGMQCMPLPMAWSSLCEPILQRVRRCRGIPRMRRRMRPVTLSRSTSGKARLFFMNT